MRKQKPMLEVSHGEEISIQRHYHFQVEEEPILRMMVPMGGSMRVNGDHPQVGK